MALVSLEQAIFAALSTYIESMTTDGGYNYDWGTCNEDDKAHKDSYPNTENHIVEDNIDESDGTGAQQYTNVMRVKIVAFGKLSSVNENPRLAAVAMYNYMLRDLKKLFGNNRSLGSLVQRIMYVGSQTETEPGGDAFIPIKLNTEWDIFYSQDRLSPETTAT